VSYRLYIFAFISSFLITLIFTPLAGVAALRFNAVDSPSGRKVHKNKIPLWGGLAVFAGIFGSILLLKFIYPSFGINAGGSGKLLEGIIAGAVFITVLGVVDDLRGMNPVTKLFGQVISILIVMQYGLRIEGLGVPFASYVSLPIFLIIFITVMWMVFFVNSINLIDGVDGLATGIMAITGFVFFIITLYQTVQQGDPAVAGRFELVAGISVVVCGSCLGFLKFNFPPAKIFLGDSGSLLLGYMAGVITVVGIMKTAATVTLAVPLIIFGVPLWDALYSLIRRLLQKKSFMEADKDHLHHRLLYRPGWTARKVSLRFYLITLLLGLAALVITVIK